jgi:hypothetical protein
MIVRYETTPEGDVGLTFEETLGAKEWKSVLGKWNDHLHEVFRENCPVHLNDAYT